MFQKEIRVVILPDNIMIVPTSYNFVDTVESILQCEVNYNMTCNEFYKYVDVKNHKVLLKKAKSSEEYGNSSTGSRRFTPAPFTPIHNNATCLRLENPWF